jgi:hypothetical protein
MISLKNEFVKVFGSVESLQKLDEEPQQTVFDFNPQSSESERSKHLWKCVFSLVGNSTVKVDTSFFKLLVGGYKKKEIEFLENFVTHMMQVCVANQFTFESFDGKQKIFGNCLLPFASLFNHSCDPNVIWIVSGMKFVFFVAKPIENGEQLFISYR